jgi:hypothetical protein
LQIIASSLLCINIFLVEALRQLRQNSGSDEVMNISYGKKFKQCSNEALTLVPVSN